MNLTDWNQPVLLLLSLLLELFHIKFASVFVIQVFVDGLNACTYLDINLKLMYAS